MSGWVKEETEMAQVKIRITVPVCEALIRGKTDAGDMELLVSRMLLELLPADHVALLAEYCGPDRQPLRRLVCESADEQGVMAALRREDSERREKARAEAREIEVEEERTAALLAGPVDDLMRLYPDNPSGARWAIRDNLPASVRSRAIAEATARNDVEREAAINVEMAKPVDVHVVERDDGQWVERLPCDNIYAIRRSVVHERALAECIRRNEALLAKYKKQEREIVDARGTTDQHERYLAWLLPEQELLELARDVLLPDLPRYERMEAADAEHESDCSLPIKPNIEFDSGQYTGGLTAGEWDVVKKIRAACAVCSSCGEVFAVCGDKIETEIRYHHATCGACNRTTQRLTVKATMKWAGRIIGREYAV